MSLIMKVAYEDMIAMGGDIDDLAVGNSFPNRAASVLVPRCVLEATEYVRGRYYRQI